MTLAAKGMQIFLIILLVIVIIAIVLFFIFQNKILHGLYNKIKNADKIDEVKDEDIVSSNHVITYKLTGVNDFKKQDLIRKIEIGSPINIKRIVDGKNVNYAACYNDREIGYLSKTFLNNNCKELLKGVRYNCVLSKIVESKGKYYPYIKLWKEENRTENIVFDRSDILRKIDYRVGDSVKHSKYGIGKVLEIKMNSVVVRFDTIREITDLKSLKLVK